MVVYRRSVSADRVSAVKLTTKQITFSAIPIRSLLSNPHISSSTFKEYIEFKLILRFYYYYYILCMRMHTY